MRFPRTYRPPFLTVLVHAAKGDVDRVIKIAALRIRTDFELDNWYRSEDLGFSCAARDLRGSASGFRSRRRASTSTWTTTDARLLRPGGVQSRGCVGSRSTEAVS